MNTQWWRRTSVLPVASVLALVLGTARPALAQRANGPYADAFGPQADENRIQGLDLTASLFGAYDANVFDQTPAADLLDPRLKDGGASGGLSGSLTYDRRSDRARFLLSGNGTAREYAASPSLGVGAYQAGTSLAVNLTPRLVLNASGGAAYSPFFQFAPFLDSGMTNVGPLGAGFGFAAVAERNLGLNASIGLSDSLTKKTTVYANAQGMDWRMLDTPANSLRSWGGRAGIRHSLTRGFGLHAEYGQDQVQYAFPGVTPYVNQTIDAGVDYGDTLSFARRTALSFSTTTDATRYLGETHYRLNGSARLTRGLSRTWSTWVGYNRDTEFRIGFRAPLLTDSVNTGVSGLLAWRVKWSAGAGYTRGVIGFGSDRFSTYSGTSRLDFALTRALALFGQYAYYHYEVPAGSSALDLVPRFSRQTATVGLSVSLPLVNDVRAPKEPPNP